MKGTQVIVTLDNCAFTMGPDGKAHLAKVPPGLSFEFDEKAGPTVDVFFGKVEIFKNKPLVPMLTSLSEFVDDTIWKFEEFVKSRP
jgi:hypothetical protein